MMREFNVEGTCIPEENYMVDISDKLEQIKELVDKKKYFTINRGRQYGKTTTLLALEKYLKDEYTVISLSFEGLGDESFANEEIFCQTLLGKISSALRFASEPKAEREKWLNSDIKTFISLGEHITNMCEEKQFVLMIDEVDRTSNNRIFLGFLSKLREKYLARRAGKDFTFYSVILAGVYDIRNIKLKMIQEGIYTPASDETAIYNSPWNIAADFEVDMSFSSTEIETMLVEYEKDHRTSMDTNEIAEEIYQFTSGYPVLVSRICKHIDKKLDKSWNVQGVRQAVKLVLKENIPLFDSLSKNLASNQELSEMIYSILMVGQRWSYTFVNPAINLGVRYGYFKSVDGQVKISNKIFELLIIEYFVYQDRLAKLKMTSVSSDFYTDVVENGKFNMQLCLEKFAKYYQRYYSEKDEQFLERESRYIFLFFLSPILNGRGFAHIESQFTDDRRMDVVVDYSDQQFIVELKIWGGDKKHKKAYDQLLGYMDKMNSNDGYLLTFDFRKNKDRKQVWVDIEDGRKIFDIRV